MLNMLNKSTSSIKNSLRVKEAGNVLFLILIAVVLFAALSYAVTQSSRSGGGGADGEANLVNSAQITQYPASVRTAIVRMIIGGVDVTSLNFDPPSAFDRSAADDCASVPTPCVFHPQGGGATNVTAPAAVTHSGGQGEWIFSSDYAIENIGTTANDIIALLPGIGQSICDRINTELGVGNTTDTGGDSDTVAPGATTLPGTGQIMNYDNPGIGTAADGVAGFAIDGVDFSGQPFGCYDSDDSASAAGELVYFHVLVER